MRANNADNLSPDLKEDLANAAVRESRIITPEEAAVRKKVGWTIGLLTLGVAPSTRQLALTTAPSAFSWGRPLVLGARATSIFEAASRTSSGTLKVKKVNSRPLIQSSWTLLRVSEMSLQEWAQLRC